MIRFQNYNTIYEILIENSNKMKQSNDNGGRKIGEGETKFKFSVLAVNCDNKENNIDKAETSAFASLNSKTNADVYFKLLTEERDRLKIKYQKQIKLKQVQIIELNKKIFSQQSQFAQQQRIYKKLNENFCNLKNKNNTINKEFVKMSQTYQKKIQQIKNKLSDQIQLSKKQIDKQHKIQIKCENQIKKLLKEVERITDQNNLKQQQYQSKLIIKTKQKYQIQNLLQRREKQNLKIIQDTEQQIIQLKNRIKLKENQIEELMSQISAFKEQAYIQMKNRQNQNKNQANIEMQIYQLKKYLTKFNNFAQKYIQTFQSQENVFQRMQSFIQSLLQRIKQKEKNIIEIEQKYKIQQLSYKSGIKNLQQENQFLRQQMKKNLLFTKMIQDIKTNNQVQKKLSFQVKPQYIFKDKNEVQVSEKQMKAQQVIKNISENKHQKKKNSIVIQTKNDVKLDKKINEQPNQFLRTQFPRPQRYLNSTQSQRCLNLNARHSPNRIKLYKKQLQQLKGKSLYQIQSSFYSQMKHDFQDKMKLNKVSQINKSALNRSHSCNQKTLAQQRKYNKKPYRYLTGENNCSLNVIQQKHQQYSSEKEQNRRMSLPNKYGRGLTLREAVTEKCKNALKKQK